MRQRLTLATGAAAAILAVSAVGLSLGKPRAPEAGGHVRVADAGVDLKSALGVFRVPQRSGDALPEELAARLEAIGEAVPGENPTQARRIELPTGVVHLWPTAAGVCTSWGACVPAADIQRDGIVVGESSVGFGKAYERLELFGLVRDGIERVDVVFAGGDRTTIRVTENVFALVLTDVGAERVPARIEWTDGDGAHSRATGVEAPSVPAERVEEAFRKAEANAGP